MKSAFEVEHLSVDRLLGEWRWLCPQSVVLIARNAFGDLFLRGESGKILRLTVSVGQLAEVCESEERFRALAEEMREDWFAEDDALAAFQRGLRPTASQCIGFKIPLMFAESGTPDNAYIADLYEQVSFLGDLNRRLSVVPDGTKVRLVAKD
jgi:hypothetical protein